MILSNEWTEEVKHSSEEIQIHVHYSTVQCKIHGMMVEVLYNPTIRANIMSLAFASTFFGKEPLAPIVKTCQIAPRLKLEGLGILHDISLYHEQIEISLDFHVFDIIDFDVMIGRPLEKFLEPSSSRDLNIKLGRDTFTIPITRAKNSVVESLPILPCPRRLCQFYPLILLSHR
jgi:hypothetical protein